MPRPIDAARAELLDRIAEAARRAGRDPSDVAIVAITKTVPADRIRQALVAGFRDFGENRVQERQAKAAALDAQAPERDPEGVEHDAARTEPDAATPAATEAPRWHLVGPLQSNKARRAIELFDVIETVDSLELAQRLERLASEIRPGRRYPVLLQVNVDRDAAKAGFEPAELERDLPPIVELRALEVRGLMTVGRLVDDADQARPTFVGLRELSERLRAHDDRLGPALSMGMSRDYTVAVEEGATLIRVGSAIFGARPTG